MCSGYLEEAKGLACLPTRRAVRVSYNSGPSSPTRGEGVNMLKSLRQRPRLQAFLGSVACLVVGAALVLYFRGQEKVTLDNFDRIQLGMTEEEIYDLLGGPESRTVELGLVISPDSYAVNFSATKELLDRGFRHVTRQQWC